MKRSLLLTVAIGIAVFATAQKSPSSLKEGIKSTSNSNAVFEDIDLTKTPSTVSYFQPEGRGTAEVSVVNLGTSANAFGLYNGGRTALWADPNLNTITFAHRMAASPGSGFIGYDVSKDGGNTWSVNNQVFNPNAGGTANARYPQGVIYNPDGNSVPDSAYFSAFFPTLDGSNVAASWGGYGAATVQLDGSNLSQVGWPSDPPIRHNVPDAMTINPVTGDIWVVEPSYIEGLATNYTDTLIITRGVFNEATEQFEYEESTFYAPMIHGDAIAGIADTRIAFAPDGQVGYIMLLADNEEDVFATGLAYYPVLFKTTDGGITWDESSITVPLGGPEGLEGIVEGLLTDDQIAELFEPPLPARDEIVYTTAFTSDFAVDYNGNPVISVVIGVAASDPYSIVSALGFFASYNIFGNAQGEGDWYAVKLGDNLKTFRGTWGDVTEDNRSQLTTTYDGTVMFFSWLDTDFEGVEDNIQPDIYCAAWDVVNNMYTEVINVTTLSEAWLQAFMGTASYYALTPEDGSYIVPFAYQEMDVTNTANPVQYKYIPDFIITEDMFTIVKANNITVSPTATVSQNYPNPFKGTTEISVMLTKQANVSLEVYNIVGQKVYEIPSATLSQGSHKLTIQSDMLKSGVYTYSVNIDGEKISRKMIVE